jgi:NAD dependent epimerase/dehydratase family enzyme
VAPVPKAAVAALRGGELANAIVASLRVVPRRALDLGYAFRFPELEPALRDLLGR